MGQGMNKNVLTLFLALTLLEFLGLSAYVVVTYGLVGWIPLLADNPVTLLLTFDLCIALSIATWWMWRDAQARGVTVWPFLALTATTRSAGPLLYAILRLRSGRA